nr:4a-hydroxytetrahydrobiopterin dehydratase [candidate division Zixibacteria bacterium]
MVEQLNKIKCIPCEEGAAPLNDAEINELLPQVTGWEVQPMEKDGHQIKALQKSFRFRNFRLVMAFLRDVEEIAETEGHHPDFCVHYSLVEFTIWTHAISGLHKNDFIIASRINEIFDSRWYDGEKS